MNKHTVNFTLKSVTQHLHSIKQQTIAEVENNKIKLLKTAIEQGAYQWDVEAIANNLLGFDYAIESNEQ